MNIFKQEKKRVRIGVKINEWKEKSSVEGRRRNCETKTSALALCVFASTTISWRENILTSSKFYFQKEISKFGLPFFSIEFDSKSSTQLPFIFYGCVSGFSVKGFFRQSCMMVFLFLVQKIAIWQNKDVKLVDEGKEMQWWSILDKGVASCVRNTKLIHLDLPSGGKSAQKKDSDSIWRFSLSKRMYLLAGNAADRSKKFTLKKERKWMMNKFEKDEKLIKTF